MLTGLSVEDLIELRLNLLYTAQKVQTVMVAVISRRQQEKNARNYTADQMKAMKLEIEHGEFMLRGSVKKILPELEVLATEEVPK
jgi:hypothetical protein